MKLRDLNAFVAVVETGSVQQAAEKIRLTQSAVTRLIQRLESEFGLMPLPPFVAHHEQTLAGPQDRLLDTILTWLSADVPVPANYQHPRIEVVSPEQLAAIRIRGSNTALQARDVSDEQWLANMRDTVALYDNDSRTIFLREGWTGATTSEISVLVHEMVHHLQNLAGDRFACPQERERAAYAAQRKWLEKTGLDFFAEFETDPMTLMLRTACGF